jgi:acyl-coenzyme A synthetase/AMP-(fatty) acid ligase
MLSVREQKACFDMLRLGAIWSSCSPDFGSSSVIHRFKQIEPKGLFAVDGYQYNGNIFDMRPIIAELQKLLPTLQKTTNALRRATQHSFP